MVERAFGMLSEPSSEEVTTKTADELIAEAGVPGDLMDPIDAAIEEALEKSDTDESDKSTEETEEVEESESGLPDMDTEDWLSKLNDDEVFNGPDGPAPRLHGLRRLAKPYIKREASRVNHLIVVPRQITRELRNYNSDKDLMSVHEEIGQHNYPMASVTFFIKDIKGRTFSDSADAFYSNCNELGLFPTAVASARAEARTLRKMLGIKQHSAEEISDKNASQELAPEDDSPAESVQVKLIQKMVVELGCNLAELFGQITTSEIDSIEELSIAQARKVINILNKIKKEQKKKKVKNDKQSKNSD